MQEKQNIKTSKIWQEWVVATTIGQMAGFAFPAIIGVIAANMTTNIHTPNPELLMMVAMTIAGIGEGAILAYAQWIILKKYIKDLNTRDWILFTAMAAALGWGIGMLPTTVGENISNLHPLALLSGIFILAPIFLLSIGFAQWLVLRKHMQKAGWWILANALAWPVGIFASIIVLILVPDNSPAGVWVLSGIMAGLMMGSTVGAITGIALVKIIRSNN